MKMKIGPHAGVSTFASRTSPSTDQSLQKSFRLSCPDKIELKNFPSLPKIKNKHPHKPTRQRQMKQSIDNGLQTWWTKGLLITAAWRNGGGSGNINSSAFNKHLCLVESDVLRKPPLRQAANRYLPF